MTQTLGTVSRALEILLLLREHGPLPLSRIAAELGVGTSTAHRLVATLREYRFVRQERDGKRYELGANMLFSASVSAIEHCVEVSRVVMEELQRTTGETVHLSVLKGRRCLFAASVESDRPVRVTSRVGAGPLAHTAAGGKVLLAALDRDRLREWIPETGLTASTAATITSETEFAAELEAVRHHGFARNLGESEDDMYAIAVPVHGPLESTIASLTIAAPLSRLKLNPRLPVTGSTAPKLALNAQESQLLSALHDASRSIEARLAF